MRSTHAVCFQKSTGLKRISVPYQVRLNIAKLNVSAKQNIILQHFLANKPRHELLGIWKKRKTFCTRGTIRENEELSPARQSIAGKHHIHLKYVPWQEKFKQSFFNASCSSNVDSVVGCSLKLFRRLDRDWFATLPKLNVKAEISELRPGIKLFVMNIAIATGF